MRKYGRTLYILFNSKLFVDFKQWSYEKRWNRTDAYPHEEICVSQRLLHISSYHSRDHHSERHQTCADSVMRGGIFSLRDIDKIECERGEAEAIAKLLNRHHDIDSR